MFMKATDKAYNLLSSMNNYPRGMIKSFATADAEATRAMFLLLFDETKNVAERIEKFKLDSGGQRRYCGCYPGSRFAGDDSRRGTDSGAICRAGQCIKQKNKSIKVIEIFLRFDA